jgi:selenocysteine lyase/cysteine desulfurase
VTDRRGSDRDVALREDEVARYREGFAVIRDLAHARLDAAAAVDALALRGVVISERRGRLRISPHFYNTEREVDRVVECVRELLDRGPGSHAG